MINPTPIIEHKRCSKCWKVMQGIPKASKPTETRAVCWECKNKPKEQGK